MTMTRALHAVLRPMIGIASANIMGQVVFIAVSLVVTRLVSPEDMGLFGHFMTLVACGSLIASMGIEGGIVAAKTKHAALLTAGTAVAASCICSIGLVLLYAALQAAGLFEATLEPEMLILGVLTIILANTYSALQFYKARNCDYASLARGGFFNNALRGVGQLIFSMTTLAGTYSLVVGETAARIFAIPSIANGKEIRLLFRLPLAFGERMMRTARAQIAPTLHFLVANVLEAFLFWVPVLLFGHLYGMAVAGFAALVARLFSAPVQIVSRAIADVYHGQAQKAQSAHLKHLTYGLWAALLSGAAIVPMIFWSIGEKGFSFIFGEEWGGIASVALAMSPLLAAQLLAPVATRLTLVRNLVRIRLTYTLACLLTSGTFWVFGAEWFKDAQSGITAYSLTIFVLCLFYLVHLARHFGIGEDR